MSELSWQQHILQLQDHALWWYESGNGPTVIALSGGPGDDHTYLRPVVEPLASQFRWILYDQRGTGRSVLHRLDEETLHPNRFVEDLESLRLHLGQERLTLVGHSWGANLALLYAVTYPNRVDRLVLVGLGPLDDELRAVAAANFMKGLSRRERQEHALLGERLERALEANNVEDMATLHLRRLALFARGAFLSPETASQFMADYEAADAHRTLNHRVNQIVGAAYRNISIWDGLSAIRGSLLVLYGYQDFEPITQAYMLRERIPQTRVCFLNRCGHTPWLEQPEAFYRELHEFLASTRPQGS